MTSRTHAERKGCVAAALVCAITAAGIAGCGGNSQPAGTPANITGNWVLKVSMGAAGGDRSIAAYLNSNNGIVSGNAVVYGACPTDCVGGCCGGPFCAGFSSSLSGTIDAKGNLMLGSAVPSGGPVFSMTATAGQGQLSNGAFTLSGSCPAQGTIAGTEYPTLAGTYSGALTSSNSGKSFQITETVNQSTSLNSSGYFDVSAAADLSGYSCVTSTTEAVPLDLNSAFLGDSFDVNMNSTPGGRLYLSGTISPDGKTMSASYQFDPPSSSCNLDYGTGTLTLQ